MKRDPFLFSSSRTPRRWSWRLGGIAGAMGATLGVLLMLAGIAGLLGRPPVLGDLHNSPIEGWQLLATGIVLLAVGIFIWRLCRQRLRIRTDLGLSPHLGKKRE
ncbi:MAG TPA: hypothetical protein VL178_01345 [Pseudomonas sp.]|jgi:hypothetical protein|nr:hypothetical protein [Pseudomonas sp.]